MKQQLLEEIYIINNINYIIYYIYNMNKGKAGIYCRENLINGKRYVGSSINLSIRFLQYFNVNHLIIQDCMYINRPYLSMVIIILPVLYKF